MCSGWYDRSIPIKHCHTHIYPGRQAGRQAGSQMALPRRPPFPLPPFAPDWPACAAVSLAPRCLPFTCSAFIRYHGRGLSPSTLTCGPRVTLSQSVRQVGIGIGLKVCDDGAPGRTRPPCPFISCLPGCLPACLPGAVVCAVIHSFI